MHYRILANIGSKIKISLKSHSLLVRAVKQLIGDQNEKVHESSSQ